MSAEVKILVISRPNERVMLDQLTTILGFVVEIEPSARVSFSTWELEIVIPAAKFIEALGQLQLQPKPETKGPVYPALDVECPKCGVPAGSWCVARSGNTAAHLHQKRELAVSP